MRNKISIIILLFSAILTGLGSCQKTEYAFGEIKAPSGLDVAIDVEGLNAANPEGNGSGNVTIVTTADNAITYKMDFGDGTVKMVPSGTIVYKYGVPGTHEYTVTVNAIGTGGVVSTISKKVKVNVIFDLPVEIMEALTNNSSKTWVTDRETPGHLGVGPSDAFTPNWWSAPPNDKAAVGCLYDDEITFTKDANNRVYMNNDNKGSTFVQGASVASYGFSGAEACYDIATAGEKMIIFSNATSASTSANSTRIQFFVPGDGIVNFALGSNTYEILSIDENSIHLRTIGVDGNAWYQKLTVKQ